MGVDILIWHYCPPKNALLYPMVHFSTYVVSEFWFCVNSHANRTHFSTAGYYFQMFFSECALIRRDRRALNQFFCRTVEKSGINECLWKLKANVGRPKILSLCFLFLELKELGSSIGDQEPVISTYPTSQKLRGAQRLLFDNGCV